MKNFMDENFLLQTETAQKLYHEHAAKMPIIDYHCHLIPQMVADDYKFKSLTEIWLGGDHYKWRAMRTNGVDERFCTGKDTTDWEKWKEEKKAGCSRRALQSPPGGAIMNFGGEKHEENRKNRIVCRAVVRCSDGAVFLSARRRKCGNGCHSPGGIRYLHGKGHSGGGGYRCSIF